MPDRARSFGEWCQRARVPPGTPPEVEEVLTMPMHELEARVVEVLRRHRGYPMRAKSISLLLMYGGVDCGKAGFAGLVVRRVCCALRSLERKGVVRGEGGSHRKRWAIAPGGVP